MLQSRPPEPVNDSRLSARQFSSCDKALAGGHGGTFIPEGIRWVVERSLGWVSRYRRLTTIFERTEPHLIAFIEIAFISILSRRLARLATQQISA